MVNFPPKLCGFRTDEHTSSLEVVGKSEAEGFGQLSFLMTKTIELVDMIAVKKVRNVKTNILRLHVLSVFTVAIFIINEPES